MERASLRDEWPEDGDDLTLEQQELSEPGLHLVVDNDSILEEELEAEEIPPVVQELGDDEDGEEDDTEPELDATQVSLRGLAAHRTVEDEDVEDEEKSKENKVDLSYDTTTGPMDSLSLMMREAGRYPLLKPTEEIMLARRIEKGDLGAKERMINSNLRLVVANARRYQGQGLAMNDLVQEGMLGLIRATEKFDWRKGFRFSTYATLWIRQAIQRGLENTSRTIRLPVHVAQRSRKIGRIERELTTKLGHEPTDEEIADMADMPVDEVIEVRQAERSVTSLDKPVGDDADTTFGELLTDKASLGLAERESEDSERRDAVNEALAVLHPREREVIKGRFLPDSGRQKTLDEMGQELGVSRERIRQIEDLALKKLKSSGYLDAFRAQVVGD